LRRRRPPLIKARALPAVLLACAGLLALHAAPALAASPAYKPDTTPLPSDVTGATSGGPSTSAGPGTGAIVRAVAGLAIVLGVIYGLYWLLRKSARGRSGHIDGRLEVVATVPLAGSRSLHLVQAGDELILVGAGESGVTPIRAYSASEAVQLGLTERRAAEPIGTSEPDAGRRSRGGGVVTTLRAWTVRS
jgi:flagellar protein FliO/FliZ